MNWKPCYAFNSDPKTLKPFLNDPNPLELCSKYLFYQISQIFWDLFAKNMKGWSGNSEIWCVEQWGGAEKKTRKQKFYLGSPSWCKYFPNIFFIIFIRKYFLKYLELCLGFFNAPFNSSPNFPLLALFSNCNWGWLWQIVLKYLLKVKLNPNILTNILSEIMRLLENGGSGKNLVQISNWHLYMGIAA